MHESYGVNYLFDVMLHEMMSLHPTARKMLEQRLSSHYCRCTPSQQQAVDALFGELFHVTFSACFEASVEHVA